KIGDITQETTEPVFTYTLEQSGEYLVSVTASDPSGNQGDSNSVAVYAGNEEPTVEIMLSNTSGQYTPGERIEYEVKVDDHGREIDPANLVVSVDYVKGTDLAGASLGHQQVSELILGRSLMMASDCQSCHKISDKSVGPDFTRVANKYQGQKDAS